MKILPAGGAFLALALSLSSGANAAITIIIQQSGADVVATTSGTFNTTGLTVGSTLMTPGLIGPAVGGFATVFANKRMYLGLTGPASFGSGGITPSFVNSGDPLLLSGNDGRIGLSTSFVSGGTVSALTTFSGATLASLGLTAGNYLYSAPNDSITLKIGPQAPVPEPASWALMIGGFALAGAAMRRRMAPRFA